MDPMHQRLTARRVEILAEPNCWLSGHDLSASVACVAWCFNISRKTRLSITSFQHCQRSTASENKNISKPEMSSFFGVEMLLELCVDPDLAFVFVCVYDAMCCGQSKVRGSGVGHEFLSCQKSWYSLVLAC